MKEFGVKIRERLWFDEDRAKSFWKDNKNRYDVINVLFYLLSKEYIELLKNKSVNWMVIDDFLGTLEGVRDEFEELENFEIGDEMCDCDSLIDFLVHSQFDSFKLWKLEDKLDDVSDFDSLSNVEDLVNFLKKWKEKRLER